MNRVFLCRRDPTLLKRAFNLHSLQCLIFIIFSFLPCSSPVFPSCPSRSSHGLHTPPWSSGSAIGSSGGFLAITAVWLYSASLVSRCFTTSGRASARSNLSKGSEVTLNSQTDFPSLLRRFSSFFHRSGPLGRACGGIQSPSPTFPVNSFQSPALIAALTAVSQIPKPLSTNALSYGSPGFLETGSMLKRISVRGQGRPSLMVSQTSWPSRPRRDCGALASPSNVGYQSETWISALLITPFLLRRGLWTKPTARMPPSQ